MARLPCKALRYLVWISASRGHRDDALIAYDEVFEETYAKFGPVYAHWWSVNQAFRSLPYGAVITLGKVATTIATIVS